MAKRPLTPSVVPATLVVSASNSLHPERADMHCTGVNDHLTIQAALDALPATGGEVLLLEGTYKIEASLVLDSYQTLRGQGRSTILTTTTAAVDIITATGGAGTEKVGIVIADLCIDLDAGGVAGGDGIVWTFVDDSLIHNILVSEGSPCGIELYTSDRCQIHGCNIANASGYGIYAETIAYSCINNNVIRDCDIGIYLKTNSHYNVIEGNTIYGTAKTYGIYIASGNFCVISSNYISGFTDGAGIEVWSNNNVISGNTCYACYYGISLTGSYNNVNGNECRQNTSHGININADYNSVASNICQQNQEHGISIGAKSHDLVVGNSCLENNQVGTTYSNIYIYTGDYNLVANNLCRQGALANKPVYGINIANVGATKNIIQGNDLYSAGATANLRDLGTLTIVKPDNREIEITQVKEYSYVKNTSGGALAAGDVVVLKAVAAGNEVTTTTTEGDQKVYGMVAETIADTAYGLVQVLGKTTALKVDGTTDIAIGDFIGTFTTAKIGMKAASGKMAFAVALEAYTNNDSNGVIDALLITPRQAI